MPGDTYAPGHADGSAVKRMLNWFTGKSAPEATSVGSQTPSIAVTPSYTPDISMTATGTEKKSVAILPFQNLAQDPASSFYEFALADSVITELAQIRSIIVRPSSVIAKYQGKQVDPREAGKELRVHAVLSAGFIRAGEKLRVTAQLLDVASGDILWSDRIDAEGSDILALQDGIAQRILEGLRLELTDLEAEKLGRRATDNAIISDALFSARWTQKIVTRRWPTSKKPLSWIRILRWRTAGSEPAMLTASSKALANLKTIHTLKLRSARLSFTTRM